MVVTGPPTSFSILERRRIELVDPSIPGSVQPYHAVVDAPLKKAEAHLKRCRDAGRILASKAVGATISKFEGQGLRVVGCGLLLSSARPLPDLAAILAAHPLIHTAEGEFFREILVYSAEKHRLPLTKVKERELFERVQTQFRISASEIQRRLSELGRSLGPPWRQDEKYAALAGLLALS